MNRKTSDQQAPNDQPIIPNSKLQYPSHNNILSYVIYFVIIVALSFTSYLFGVNQGVAQNMKTLIVPTATQQPLPSLQPTITKSDVNTFGETTVSYADSGTDIYLMHKIELSDNKAAIPNSNIRSMTNIYSQDVSYEPVKIDKIDVNNLSWIELVKQPISDIVNSSKILVWDSLFSFKLVPYSKSFLFAEEFHRSGDKTESYERRLYYYDRSTGVGTLREVKTFTREKDGYSYPKINFFSQDGRYAEIELYRCWGCGGHMPETLLLDLQTLKTKNIGKVLQFLWGQNGSYTYKDYVVIDCTEPTPGECRQDPNTLPLKTGQY